MLRSLLGASKKCAQNIVFGKPKDNSEKYHMEVILDYVEAHPGQVGSDIRFRLLPTFNNESSMYKGL